MGTLCAVLEELVIFRMILFLRDSSHDLGPVHKSVAVLVLCARMFAWC